MVGLYRDNAVVLRSWKLGEADRIVSLMTQANGKIRCVAKGARKTQSRFGARVEPTNHIQVQLYRGKGDLDTLTQVESIDRYPMIREDLELFARASEMLEAVEQVAQEREPNEGLYVMLAKAMHTVSQSSSDLVVAGFFLKLLAQEGFAPAVDVCVSCGATTNLTHFSVSDGGTTCGTCRLGTQISVEALALMQLALGGHLGAVLNQSRSAATHEVDVLATRLLEYMLERRLRSATVLEQA
ncbi:MAG: DNA repair protein RecO [Acidimicrobiales bacterium]|nr:MAG: DNA repair protein RecO [Acidimicrobiales bacterium]